MLLLMAYLLMRHCTRNRQNSHAVSKKKYSRGNIVPMNQQAQDLMMLAPAEVDKTTLDELNLEVKPTEE